MIYVLRGESMGEGDAALGARLLGTFLKTLSEVEPRPDAVVFYNAAVKLLAPSSPYLEQLKALDALGVDLLACVTCLEHFALTRSIAVGQISNMREIVQHLAKAEKVITV